MKTTEAFSPWAKAANVTLKDYVQPALFELIDVIHCYLNIKLDHFFVN